MELCLRCKKPLHPVDRYCRENICYQCANAVVVEWISQKELEENANERKTKDTKQTN